MQQKLSDAGRKMIAAYLEREASDRPWFTEMFDWKRNSMGADWMTLPSGDGAVKSALMKLKAQGFAEGGWNVVRGMGGGGYMRPTAAGRAAFHG